MGKREGTRPKDDVITRAISRRAVLRVRGIKLIPALAEDRALFDAVSGDALLATAVACRDEPDFRRRLRKPAR